MIDIRGLSYFVAESTDPVQWQRYAEDVLGMMVMKPPPCFGVVVEALQ